MRIVVYTPAIANQSGGEINARDWGLGLKARGHQIAAYTPIVGAPAAELRDQGVPVVDDPAALGDGPDILFGSGINETVALLARFPDVPAVQVSQGWEFWVSLPAPLPQVMRHVAVDAINGEMLANEFGI